MGDPIERLGDKPSPRRGFVVTEAVALAAFSLVWAAAQVLEPGNRNAVITFGVAATLSGFNCADMNVNATGTSRCRR